MNVVFIVLVTASLIMLCTVSPESAITVMLNGVSGSIQLALKLCAIYAVWVSVLSIMEKTNMTNGLYRLLKPLCKKLFKGESDKAYEYISMNLATNLLGMGGAATPMGIKAVEEMSKGKDKASDNLILFTVINATSIQLLPMTIISLRAAAGSSTASDIIIPSLIATACTTLIGGLLCFVLREIKRKNKNKPNEKPLYDKH